MISFESEFSLVAFQERSLCGTAVGCGVVVVVTFGLGL